MMDASIESRARYRPDGGMQASAWPALFAAAFVVPLAAGGGLFWLERHHWYLVILAPAAGALLVGVALAAVVALTHCRQPLVAGGAGATAALIMLLAYYDFGMINELPPGNVHRLDRLPGYIADRLATDVEEEIGVPRPQVKKPDRFGNSLRLAIEATLAMFLAAFPPARRARRPYVTDLGQWMSREEKRLPAGTFDAFHLALETGSLADFARRIKADSAALARAALARHYASCVVEYVRHPRTSPLEFPVYVTFLNDAANMFDRRRNTLRQVRLEPRETIALRPLFPHLDRILTAFQVVEDGSAALEPPPAAHPGPATISGREAVISDVEGGGMLRTGNFLLMINLLGLIPLVTFFGGLALIVAGGWGFFHEWSAARIVACVVVGVLSFLEGAIQAQSYSGLLETWYARRRLMNILVLRPDPIVAVNNPDAEMVNLTKRENWIKVQLDVQDDVGLLEIDGKRRELRIEGDKRRYRVPLEAIVSCQPECFHHPLDKQLQNQYWYVRLVVPVDGREEELLLALAFRDWRRRTNANRQLLASQLCRRLTVP